MLGRLDLSRFLSTSKTTPEYLLKHQECVLLNRVLSDKTKLPPACFAPPSARAERRVSKRRKAALKPVPQDESAIGDLVRRITGAVQPVLGRFNTPVPPKRGVCVCFCHTSVRPKCLERLGLTFHVISRQFCASQRVERFVALSRPAFFTHAALFMLAFMARAWQ